MGEGKQEKDRLQQEKDRLLFLVGWMIRDFTGKEAVGGGGEGSERSRRQ